MRIGRVLSGGLLLLALACTAFAYVIFYRLIGKLGATRASSVTYLVPVFGVLWGALWLGEAVSAAMLGGGVLILASLTVSTLLWANLSNGFVWVVLLVTLAFGAVGAIGLFGGVRTPSAAALEPYRWTPPSRGAPGTDADVIVRTVQLPSADEERLAGALQLNASTFVLGRTPHWRVASALLPRERGGVRTGLVIEWPEDSAAPDAEPALADDLAPTTYAPAIAGLTPPAGPSTRRSPSPGLASGATTRWPRSRSSSSGRKSSPRATRL